MPASVIDRTRRPTGGPPVLERQGLSAPRMISVTPCFRAHAGWPSRMAAISTSTIPAITRSSGLRNRKAQIKPSHSPVRPASCASPTCQRSTHSLTRGGCDRKKPGLAAAANALDLAVEHGVFLIELGVAALFRRHVAGAGLPVPDRGRRRTACFCAAPIPLLPVCAIATGPPNQKRRPAEQVAVINFRIARLPSSRPSFYRERSGISIMAQLRRPCAAQSCALRTSAMEPSSQIPPRPPRRRSRAAPRFPRGDCPDLPVVRVIGHFSS